MSKEAISTQPLTINDPLDPNGKAETEGGQHDVEKVGNFGCIMNVLNALLGAGLLSVPSTFKDCGIAVGVTLVALMAIISHFATVPVIILQQQTKSEGFSEVARKVMGKPGGVILSIMIIVFNGGACLAYLVIGVDFITSWFGAAGIDITSSEYRALTALVYGLSLPIMLSLFKSLKFLSYFSTATIFLVISFVVVMSYEAVVKFTDHGISPTVEIAKIGLGFFSSLSVYTITFSLPTSVIPVFYGYTEDVKKRIFMSWLSLLVCFLLTVTPGILGYFMFGDETVANILNNFDDNDIPVMLIRIFFFCVVTMSYPLIQLSVQCAWADLIFGVNQAVKLVGWRRAAMLVMSNGYPLIVSMFLPEVKPAIEVPGALGGCVGNLVIPGVMWFMGSPYKKTHWSNILAIILAVFGGISSVIGTYMAVLAAIEAFRKVHF